MVRDGIGWEWAHGGKAKVRARPMIAYGPVKKFGAEWNVTERGKNSAGRNLTGGNIWNRKMETTWDGIGWNGCKGAKPRSEHKR